MIVGEPGGQGREGWAVFLTLLLSCLSLQGRSATFPAFSTAARGRRGGLFPEALPASASSTFQGRVSSQGPAGPWERRVPLRWLLAGSGVQGESHLGELRCLGHEDGSQAAPCLPRRELGS